MTANVPGTLTKGVQAIVDAVAQRHPKPATLNQVARLSGYSVRSSTFDTYVARARAAGLVEGAGEGSLRLTQLGAGVATTRAPRSAVETQNFWLSRVGGGERKLLTILIAAHPEPVARARLAEQSGYSATSSTFETYIARIRALGLATIQSGSVRASDDLFPTGKRR